MTMQITVFTKQNCQACEATKKALDRAGLGYNVSDVSDSPTLQQTLRECGFRTMPVIKAFDGENHRYWEGFRPDLIKRLQMGSD